MAMQTGVAASKVLVIVGAGLTGSIILRSGHLSDIISHIQELIQRLNEAEKSPGKYDAALLATQVRLLAKEIKELSLSNPVTIFNGNSSSNGSYASYLLPTAALGAMGCCYMWWKGWSFSEIMFVTKQNMANAVASVSKQLEHVSEALASTRRHLSKRLENLDWKLDEQREISKLISNDVGDVKSNLNQIGYDIGLIQETLSGLEGKIELLESKQDMTNSGLWYLCHVAGNIEDGRSSKIIQMKPSHVYTDIQIVIYSDDWIMKPGLWIDVGAKLIDNSTVLQEAERAKGLQFIIGDDEPNTVVQKTSQSMDGKDANFPSKKVHSTNMRIHRSYPVGLSVARDILG